MKRIVGVNMKIILVVILTLAEISLSFVAPRFLTHLGIRPYYAVRNKKIESEVFGLGYGYKLCAHTFPSMDENTTTFFSKKTFSEIGLMSAGFKDALKRIRVETPSRIQAISFKSIYEGRDVILAEQTGSGFNYMIASIQNKQHLVNTIFFIGKTLAYLLPILQRTIELKRNLTISTIPLNPLVII